MRLKNGFTPKEEAYSIAIERLRGVHRRMVDLDVELTPKQDEALMDAVAKLHNQLLERSGLDGIALPCNKQGERCPRCRCGDNLDVAHCGMQTTVLHCRTCGYNRPAPKEELSHERAS